MPSFRKLQLRRSKPFRSFLYFSRFATLTISNLQGGADGADEGWRHVDKICDLLKD